MTTWIAVFTLAILAIRLQRAITIQREAATILDRLRKMMNQQSVTNRTDAC